MATSTATTAAPPSARRRLRSKAQGRTCESCGHRRATRVVSVFGTPPDPVRPDGRPAPAAAPFYVCAPCADLTT